MEHPQLFVSEDARDAATIPEGSALVLLPKPSDAAFLNLERPLFARRALKVVLFCDHDTTVELTRRAPDFFDWISQHQECPPGRAEHAVQGLRAALTADEPVVWTGADMEGLLRAFSAAFPGQTPRWIAPTRAYQEIVLDVLSAGSAWVACRPRAASHLRRFRWAVAESGRRSRVLVMTDTLRCPGYWPVHDRITPFGNASSALRAAGASRPGLLAALTGLEPEAVDLARGLLRRGAQEEHLLRTLRDSIDPGAALGREMHGLGGVSLDLVAERRAPPPVLRAFVNHPEVERLRDEHLASIGAELAKGTPAKLGLLAAIRGTAAPLDSAPPEDPEGLGFIVEAGLRTNSTHARRARLAEIASRLGEPEAAECFLRNSRVSPGQPLQSVAVSGIWWLRSLAPAVTFYLRTRVDDLLPAEAAGGSWILRASRAVIDAALAGLKHIGDAWVDEALVGNYAEVARILSLYLNKISVPELREAELFRMLQVAYAAMLANLRENDNALSVLDKAISLESRLTGGESEIFTYLILVLAQVLTQTGRAANAEALLHKLLGPEASLPGDDAPPPRAQLGAFGMSPDTEEALALFLAQPTDRRPALKNNRANALHLLADALLVQGRYDEAEALIGRALRSNEAGPPKPQQQSDMLATLGRILAVQQRYPEAHKALTRAASLVSADEGAYLLDRARVLHEIARVERHMGKPDEAARTAARALDLFARAGARAEESSAREELKSLLEDRPDRSGDRK